MRVQDARTRRPATAAIRENFSVPLTTIRWSRAENFQWRENFHHWYYRRSIAIVKDIKVVLNATPPDEIANRNATPGERGVYRLNSPKIYYDANKPRDEHDHRNP